MNDTFDVSTWLRERLTQPWAKDARLTLDGALQRSSALSTAEVWGVALAAAFYVGQPALFETIDRGARAHLDEAHRHAALAAASLMKMTNVMYSFKELVADFEDVAAVKPDLRMSAYANHGGAERRFFELSALAVSAIGKCKPCVRSHTDVLIREEKASTETLRDAVRLASAINAVAAALVAA